MNHKVWEDLFSNPIFATLPEINRRTILKQITATNLTKVVSFEAVISNATALEISSMETMPVVPTMTKLPMLKQPATKDKQKKPMLVRQSLRKNPKVQQKEKKGKQPEKFMELEEQEFQMEELDVEEFDPITWILKYIPLQKGKAKVKKDPNYRKFTVSTPLLHNRWNLKAHPQHAFHC